MDDRKNSGIRESLKAVYAAQRRYYQQSNQRIGLAPGQGQGTILNQLLKEDHLTQRELADRCRMDTATTSRALDRLEEMGLLSRQKMPESRRAFQIVLTDAGREKAELVRSYLDRLDDALTAAAEEAGGEPLTEALHLLAERVEGLE